MEHAESNPQPRLPFVMPTPRIPIAESFDASKGDREKVNKLTLRLIELAREGFTWLRNRAQGNFRFQDGKVILFFKFDQLANVYEGHNGAVVNKCVGFEIR